MFNFDISLLQCNCLEHQLTYKISQFSKHNMDDKIYKDSAIIQKVWEKAAITDGKNPDLLRKDYAGAWIKRDDYNKLSTYGWQIDHILPLSQGGTDDIDNLVPLHWRNNKSKGDDYPRWHTEVTSESDANILKNRLWKISDRNDRN